MEMSTSRPRYHYFSMLHLKRINYWLGKKPSVNLHFFVSKKLRILKVTLFFTKNVKEMLNIALKVVVKEMLNYRVKSFMANCWPLVFKIHSDMLKKKQRRTIYLVGWSSRSNLTTFLFLYKLKAFMRLTGTFTPVRYSGFGIRDSI